MNDDLDDMTEKQLQAEVAYIDGLRRQGEMTAKLARRLQALRDALADVRRVQPPTPSEGALH
jgi:hypothetical protein